MEFTPSSVHNGRVTFSNPKTAGFDYTAILCMGAGWTEMASVSFHLDAGQSKDVQFSVTMPSAPGTYPVYFKVNSGGVLIGTFVAKEDVVIGVIPIVYGATITISMAAAGVNIKELIPGQGYAVLVTITNKSTKAGGMVAATLGMGILGVIDSILTLIPRQVSQEAFGPGETREFNYGMTVPAEARSTGGITAWVEDPAGNKIAEANQGVTATGHWANLSGVVKDSLNNQPVAGVTVNLYDANGAVVQATTTTSASGAYSFTSILSGEHYIGFNRADYKEQVTNVVLRTIDTTLDISLVPLPPGVFTLNYTNPKQGSNTWEAWAYDLNTKSWSPDITPIRIGDRLAFPALTGNTFLLRFRENLDRFWNDYQYGPFVVTVPGVGLYTWDARAETLNGVSFLNLPKSNNLCTITGTCVGFDQEYGTVSIKIESTADISGYTNAGKYFVGQTFVAKVATNPYWLYNQKVTGKLKMVLVPITNTGYTYGWELSDIKFSTGTSFPSWAYVFGGSLTRETEMVWNDHNYDRVKYAISGDSRLSQFAVFVYAHDTETDTDWILYRTTGPSSGYVTITGPGYYGYLLPYYVGAQLWANPDPKAVFTRPDQAPLYGWVRVA